MEDFQNDFYLMAMRVSFGQFTFESTFIDNTTFPSLNFQPDSQDITNYQCIIANNNFRTKQLDIIAVECSEEHNIICRKIIFSKPKCSQHLTFKNKNAFSIMLNENLKQQFKTAIALKKAEMISMFQRINLTQAYESIITTLWNSNTPCFDLRNKTSDINGEGSILRYCQWKGITIPCSAIFTTVPTDQGLCCAFNMKAAEEIFVESTFRNTLETMQASDKMASFLPNKLPAEYTKSGEPKTTSGRHKGLVILLDAHSDDLGPGSRDEDFHGFRAIIESSGSFPLIAQEGLSIRCQFHQNFMCSFYVQRFPMRKKTVKSSSFLCFWDLC